MLGKGSFCSALCFSPKCSISNFQLEKIIFPVGLLFFPSWPDAAQRNFPISSADHNREMGRIAARGKPLPHTWPGSRPSSHPVESRGAIPTFYQSTLRKTLRRPVKGKNGHHAVCFAHAHMPARTKFNKERLVRVANIEYLCILISALARPQTKGLT